MVRVKKLLKKHDIHLIYCADNLSKIIGGIAGKWAGVSVVAHCHDDLKEDFLGKSIRIIYLIFLDRIIAVSEKVRSFFKVRGEISPKTITIYNGIDANIYDPDRVDKSLMEELGIKVGSIIVGSISVIEKDKGQKYLFEAIEKLRSEGMSDIVCVICGEGPEEENLKEFVKIRNLTDKVLFLGFRKDIPRVLKTLDIIVMTSLTIEAFPMVAIEAMSMAVPVIGTNVGGLPEAIDNGKTGILIPPGDVDALCGALRYLIKNPQVRVQMGKNGRKRVLERFTIEENVRKTEEVYLHLLNARQKPPGV